MPNIIIENHGPAIVASNYWGGPDDVLPYVSVHAGAIRVLLPSSGWSLIDQARQSRHAILSLGPWQGGDAPRVEIMFDSLQTIPPPCLILSNQQMNQVPMNPAPGYEWVVTLWVEKRGRPHRALDRICFWRRVDRIPCLLPWPAEGVRA